MKWKALRKHSLQEKTAASVLLKLFISSKYHLFVARTRRINTTHKNYVARTCRVNATHVWQGHVA